MEKWRLLYTWSWIEPITQNGQKRATFSHTNFQKITSSFWLGMGWFWNFGVWASVTFRWRMSLWRRVAYFCGKKTTTKLYSLGTPFFVRHITKLVFKFLFFFYARITKTLHNLPFFYEYSRLNQYFIKLRDITGQSKFSELCIVSPREQKFPINGAHPACTTLSVRRFVPDCAICTPASPEGSTKKVVPHKLRSRLLPETYSPHSVKQALLQTSLWNEYQQSFHPIRGFFSFLQLNLGCAFNCVQFRRR